MTESVSGVLSLDPVSKSIVGFCSQKVFGSCLQSKPNALLVHPKEGLCTQERIFNIILNRLVRIREKTYISFMPLCNKKWTESALDFR